VRRAVTLADGYLGGNVPLAQVAPLVDQLRRAAQEAGRDPASMRVVCRGSVRVQDEPHPGDDRRPLWGTLDQVAEDIARYQEAGLDELFIELNFDPAIAAPDVDPDRSLATALTVLEALAPATT
jgi:alkanesulfonate monooxygenase SsuD/methylene tetrahydromethanopterin reductase-like flavin-dependent oxidoreductase (luciferase family)